MAIGTTLSVLLPLLEYSLFSGGGSLRKGKYTIHLMERNTLTFLCRKYTGPQTNDIIQEIPSEAINDGIEPDDITV